jgi:hypothetical protein
VEHPNGDPRGDDESPQPRSILGLPVRALLGVAAISLPLLAVGAFSATHSWAAPADCMVSQLFCSGAPPLDPQPFDLIFYLGPVLGLVSAATAIGLRREPTEHGTAVTRYLLPTLGLFVTLGTTVTLALWVAH